MEKQPFIDEEIALQFSFLLQRKKHLQKFNISWITLDQKALAVFFKTPHRAYPIPKVMVDIFYDGSEIISEEEMEKSKRLYFWWD